MKCCHDPHIKTTQIHQKPCLEEIKLTFLEHRHEHQEGHHKEVPQLVMWGQESLCHHHWWLAPRVLKKLWWVHWPCCGAAAPAHCPFFWAVLVGDLKPVQGSGSCSSPMWPLETENVVQFVKWDKRDMLCRDTETDRCCGCCTIVSAWCKLHVGGDFHL